MLAMTMWVELFSIADSGNGERNNGISYQQQLMAPASFI
ncbi:MAG: hypothetical protein OJF50_002083 [Nitrospira sp.]|nr:hypothetical protein [Nitrospira sp.]